MVGFMSEHSTIIQEEEDSKASNFKDPIDPFDLKLTNFADSFLDFDSIQEFFEDPVGVSLDIGDFGKRMEVEDKGCVVKDLIGDRPNLVLEDKEQIVCGSNSGCLMKVKEESLELEREENMGCSVEEEMAKVSLICGSNPVISDGGVLTSEVVRDQAAKKINGSSINGSSSVVNSVNEKVMSDEGKSEDEGDSESNLESDSESSSSASGSESSSDDDEEELDKESDGKLEEGEEVRVEMNKEVDGLDDVEEGEIRDVNGEGMVIEDDDDDQEEELKEEEEDIDKMAEWGDVEFSDDDGEDEDAGAKGEPIRSKHELKNLPLVPPVEASLQPHHQMLPVGVVLSVMGPQVIVEGVEKHNPLNEGSILWVTEKRSPLGLVDEIFGPVKNPYYVVRYNSESEVPAGIHNGTLVSFVPEFANHVLNDKNLFKKGYDASGENDEELGEDAEFSDDEKEAEHKRMLKMSKRGMNDQATGRKKKNRSKVKNRDGDLRNNSSGQQTPTSVGQLPPNQNLHAASAVGASFPPVAQNTGAFAPPTGVWTNVTHSQQPQSTVIHGFAPNMPWPAPIQLQYPYQMPMPNGMPIPQPFNPSQGSLPNTVLPGGRPNFFTGPAYVPFPGGMGQNFFNQTTFGTGFQVRPNPPTMNVVDQGMMSSGLPIAQNSHFQPAVPSENIQAPQESTVGESSSRGRKPYHRGGGRFAGRRGRLASK